MTDFNTKTEQIKAAMREHHDKFIKDGELPSEKEMSRLSDMFAERDYTTSECTIEKYVAHRLMLQGMRIMKQIITGDL